MPIIDSDAHVIETERTWEFMREEEQDFQPFVVVPKQGSEANLSGGFSGRRNVVQEFWIIEGRAVSKRSNFRSVEVSEEAAEAADIEKRLAHMDELGVDVHVLYPTIFLRPLTRRPEVEIALYGSYNRWMNEIYERGEGRLRWAAMLPYMTREKAIEEMHWAKDHGACGFFMHSMEGERRLSEPYFDPIYREASALGLPMCIHATSGNFSQFDLFQLDAGFSTFKLPVVGAFHDLLMKQVPSKYPDLRWAFVEVSSEWVPYALNDMMLRFKKAGRDWPAQDILRDNNMYVACQTADDLDWVLETVGDDNIVIGSDYGHNDTSSELKALSNLRDSGRVPAGSAAKILEDNARALYAL
jgi:predicted TIM-barrel fold metal-dependent hydrolase